MVLEGQVQLTTSSPRGEITVRIAGPGESLPLAALLGSGKLITTAYAMTDLRGMEIPRDKLRELLLQQPAIGMKVYQAMADILGGRYQNTLTRLVGTMEHALRQADVFANV
jgi:CRP-like cAMP-binding protein